MARPFTKIRQSKFKQVLKAEGLTGAKLNKYAHEVGLGIDKNSLYPIINQSRDFHLSTGCRLLQALNKMTGKDYTLTDVFTVFKFQTYPDK